MKKLIYYHYINSQILILNIPLSLIEAFFHCMAQVKVATVTELIQGHHRVHVGKDSRK